MWTDLFWRTSFNSLHYVKNYHKFSSLKAHPFISLQLCRSEVWVWQGWVLCSVSQAKSVSAKGFPVGPVVKTLPCNTGDAGLIPGWELRSHMLHGMVNKKKK